MLEDHARVCPHCGCVRPTAPLQDTPLTGRERELIAIYAHIDRCIAGMGGLFAISGPAGIGKTRLLDAALAYAKQQRCFDFPIRGFEPNMDLPYWALAEALHTELALTADAVAGDAYPPGALDPMTAMRNLAEPLRSAQETHPGGTAGFESRETGVNARVYEANAAVIRGLTALRPLVILADDLQWFDTPTLNLMRHTLRIAKTLPLLIICAYRDDGESATRFRPLLEDAAREGLFTEMSLEGLEPADARRLAQAAAPTPLTEHGIEETLRLAEGNPFYVTQLARAFAGGQEERRAPLPAALRGFTDARLAGLSPGCRALIQALAIVGRECPLDLLTRIATVPLPDLAAALDEALAAHVLIEREAAGRPRYDFVHALLREAAVREMNALARASLHLRVADALHELRRTGNSRDPAAEIAGHYLDAQPLAPADRVLAYALEAAGQAEAMGAHEQAARFLSEAVRCSAEQGLALPQIAALRVRLVDTYGRTGDLDAARREADATHAIYSEIGDPEAAAAVHALLAEHLNPRIRPREVIAHADAGLTLLGDARTPVSARLRYLRAHARHMSDDSADLLPTANWLEHHDFTPPEPSAPIWSCLLRVLWHIWNSSDTNAILTLVQEATAAARALGDRRAEALTRIWEAQVLERDARPRAALAALDDALQLAREAGSASLLVDARALRVEALLQMGRWQELEETVDEALPALVRLGSTYFGYELIAVHAWSRQLRGQPWSPPHGLEVRFHESMHFVAAYRANAAREAAERGTVDARATRTLDWLTASVPVSGPGLAWATAGVPTFGALTLAGRRDDVAARYEGVARFPRFMLYASFAPLDRGRADVLLKRWEAAETHFDEATRIATDEGLHVALARTLIERGTMYRLRGRRGDRARAATVLERAIAMCTELGLEPDAARARALLEQAGPVAPATLPAGLTPREAEVLHLLAGGRTNRQIADDLTISEKTVEQHLLNIYQKLGVDSRAKAVAFAFAHGLM